PLDTAELSANGPTEPSENTISEVHDLLNTSIPSPRLRKALPPCERGLKAIDVLLRPATIGTDEDVLVHVRRKGVPVTAAEGGVASTNGLHVLLRHRLTPRGRGRRTRGRVEGRQCA